jgi:hypothetical protein
MFSRKQILFCFFLILGSVSLSADFGGRDKITWATLIAQNPFVYGEYKMKLEKAQKILNDAKAQKFIKSVLKDPSSLVDMSALDEIFIVFGLLDGVERLESIKEDIKDDEGKLFIKKVLSDHSLLRDPDVKIVERKMSNRVSLARALKRIQDDIRDQETKILVSSWLENTKLLEDPDVIDQAKTIRRRVAFVKKLVKIQKKIRDQETKKLVESWLKNTKLLDDLSACEEAGKILNRVFLVEVLVSIENKATNDEQKLLIKKWLANTPLLDDPEVFESACQVCNQVMLAYKKNRLVSLKKAKDAGIIFYTIYRKMMFVRAIDRGEAAGWAQRVLNFVGLMSYMGAEAYERYLKAGESVFGGIGSFLQNPDVAGSFSYRVSKIASDDVSSFINQKFHDEFTSEKNVLTDKKTYEEIAEEQSKKLREEGFHGKELNFFDAFDSHLNRLLEKKVNHLLKTVKIPYIFRKILWKNGSMNFVRRMLLFKVFPTFVYYQGKVWFGGYKDKGDRIAFKKYIPFKEAVKSVGSSLQLKLSHSIVSFFNHKSGPGEKGLLDITKNLTFGLVGPNIIPFVFKLFSPYAFIALSKKIRPGFLTNADYEIKKTKKAQITYESIKYCSKAVSTFLLTKVLRKVRPGVVSWAGKKVRKFLRFLSRRGWIDKYLVDMLDYGQMGSNAAGMLAGMVGSSLYNIIWTTDNTITDYDQEEAYEEMVSTGDGFRFFDYILAAWIGNYIGREVATWSYDKLVKARAFE